ncbi:hypothetical protein MKX01_001173 [Papaver californicum]|nr:hypothetical protein MKX01_001173 [Papaver californicum]
MYTIRLSRIPSCNCPDSAVPCKHILFVYMFSIFLTVAMISDLGPPPKPELGKCVKYKKEMYAEDIVSDCGAGVCESVGHAKCMIYRKPSGGTFCAGCGSR